jgi:hypothetical protein
MELSEQQEQQPNPAAAVMETEETSSAEVFYHPETGERISKNAYKKLLKGKLVGELVVPCSAFISLFTLALSWLVERY